MTVYVVILGSEYEGGRVVGVYRSLKRARQVATSCYTRISPCLQEWVEKETNCWTHEGCFVNVEEHEVEE